MDNDLAFDMKRGPFPRSVCTAGLLHKGLLLCCSERIKCTTFRVHLVSNGQGVILIRILPTSWSRSISRRSACDRYIGQVDSSRLRLLALLERVSSPDITPPSFCPCARAFAAFAFQRRARLLGRPDPRLVSQVRACRASGPTCPAPLLRFFARVAGLQS